MTRLDLPSFLPFRLNRIAAEVSRQLSAVYAREFGLDIPQWRVLATLGNGRDWTAQAIVASTRTHKSTISRAVQDLVERGLVERRPSREDKRSMALALSTAGAALMDEIAPKARAYESAVLARIGAGDRDALLRGLAAMEAAFGLTSEDHDA